MRACQFWGFIDNFVIYCIGYLYGGQARWNGGHTKLNGGHTKLNDGQAMSKELLRPHILGAAGRCFSHQEKKLVWAIDRCPVWPERRRSFIFFLASLRGVKNVTGRLLFPWAKRTGGRYLPEERKVSMRPIKAVFPEARGTNFKSEQPNRLTSLQWGWCKKRFVQHCVIQGSHPSKY